MDNDSVDTFVDSISTYSQAQVAELEKETRGQYKNPIWYKQRLGRITGSIIHEVETKVKILIKNKSMSLNDNCSLLNTIVSGSSLNPNIPALKYGRENESKALKQYLKHQSENGHQNIKVHECGLYVSKKRPYIGASPDGIVSCYCCGEGVLEIKCPFKIAHKHPKEGGVEYLVKVGGVLQLNHSHKYYSQVQTEMGVTGKMWCDFVVFTHQGLLIQRIPFNKNKWQALKRGAEYFFKNHVAQKLLCKAQEETNMQ